MSSKSKKLKQIIRKRDFELRKKDLKNQEATIKQAQIVKDYIQANSTVDRKNEKYPVTEKVFHGSPETLKAILGEDDLKFNPSDYPEGLVIPNQFLDQFRIEEF